MDEGNAQQGASQAYYDELAREGKIQSDEAQQEYADQAGLRKQMIDEATLTPDKVEAARSKSMADVAQSFEGAKAAQQRSQEAQGINPGDPAAVAGSNATNVNLAAAQVGSGNTAATNEKTYRGQLAASVTGRQAPTMSGAAGAVGSAASGYQGLAGQNYSIGQNREAQSYGLIPSFSIKRGGMVKTKGRGFKPMTMRTHEGQVLPTSAGPARGRIDGPGTGTSDQVDAKLSKGEYVQTAKSTSAIKPRNLDALTELGHRAADGDSEAKVHLKHVVGAIKASGVKAPVRIAGESPRPAGRGFKLKADDGGYTPSQQKFVDSTKKAFGGSDSSSMPSGDKIRETIGDIGSGIAEGASKAFDFAKKHVSSQGAIADIKGRSPLWTRGSRRGGHVRGKGLKLRVRAAEGGDIDAPSSMMSRVEQNSAYDPVNNTGFGMGPGGISYEQATGKDEISDSQAKAAGLKSAPVAPAAPAKDYSSVGAVSTNAGAPPAGTRSRVSARGVAKLLAAGG